MHDEATMHQGKNQHAFLLKTTIRELPGSDSKKFIACTLPIWLFICHFNIDRKKFQFLIITKIDVNQGLIN
ncbi:hypothetical protein HBA_0196 [Sodalis endosymbiont of Henestaris halophilus]|nr:hypothetical protein HBA_0196 [Sodalis endosymbiont of Henestaris halophilus]